MGILSDPAMLPYCLVLYRDSANLMPEITRNMEASLDMMCTVVNMPPSGFNPNGIQLAGTQECNIHQPPNARARRNIPIIGAKLVFLDRTSLYSSKPIAFLNQIDVILTHKF